MLNLESNYCCGREEFIRYRLLLLDTCKMLCDCMPVAMPVFHLLFCSCRAVICTVAGVTQQLIQLLM